MVTSSPTLTGATALVFASNLRDADTLQLTCMCSPFAKKLTISIAAVSIAYRNPV